MVMMKSVYYIFFQNSTGRLGRYAECYADVVRHLLSWADSIWLATLVVTGTGNIIPVATATARSVVAVPRTPGYKHDWLKCCRYRIRIWCLRCHTLSMACTACTRNG